MSLTIEIDLIFNQVINIKKRAEVNQLFSSMLYFIILQQTLQTFLKQGHPLLLFSSVFQNRLLPC